MISGTGVMLYLWYEYYEEGCFELVCFLGERVVSDTRVVKGDVVVTIVVGVLSGY